MADVLVVDDSAVDCKLVAGLFRRDESLTVTTVGSGVEALDRMEQDSPDLVVTDLVMPEIDGLQVVEEVKRRWPAVPVVLMTSSGNEEIASEALKRGAAGYVSKSRLEKDLVNTVQNLLNIAAGRADFAHVMSRMQAVNLRLAVDNDWSHIHALVKFFQDGVAHMGLFDETDRTRIGVALTEAMMNAIVHGNLQVDSILREESMVAFFDQAAQRLRVPPYCERRVQIEAFWSHEECRFVIRDDGLGFDVAALPDPTDPANLERASGRGVMLMQMFMDEVIYNAAGNEVTMVKRKHPLPVTV